MSAVFVAVRNAVENNSEVYAQPAQGLGFPAWGRLTDPGERGEFTLALQKYVAQRSPGQVTRRDPFAHKASDAPDTRLGVYADAGGHVSGNGDGPTPVMGDLKITQLRKHAAQGVRQFTLRACALIETRVDA